MIFDRFRGILAEVEGEGTHFRVPWVQTPHIMDIRTRPRTISSVTGTKGKGQHQLLPLLLAGASRHHLHDVWVEATEQQQFRTSEVWHASPCSHAQCSV